MEQGQFPGELCDGRGLRLDRLKRLDRRLPEFVAVVKGLF